MKNEIIFRFHIFQRGSHLQDVVKIVILSTINRFAIFVYDMEDFGMQVNCMGKDRIREGIRKKNSTEWNNIPQDAFR